MKTNYYRGLLTILFFSVFITNVFAQNNLIKQWDRRFGGSNVEKLFSFQPTADGGYLLAGWTVSPISGDKTQNTQGFEDYWIVKIDSSGIKQWDRDFGGSGSDLLQAAQQTNDGGYILGGTSFSDISGDKSQNTWGSSGASDFWIIKTDSLGNKQWDKDFGGTSNDCLTCLTQTSDGGFMLGGFSASGINGDKTEASWGSFDYWVIKIDSTGNKQWDKVFGGTNQEQLNCIEQTKDGGYVLTGYSLSNISGNKTQNSWGQADYWIVKIDSLGNKLWDKDFGGTGYDNARFCKQTVDDGYIIGGYSYSGISGDKTQNTWGSSDYWIIKIDSLGNKQWDKDFGGNHEEEDFGNITLTADGGYLIAGTSYSPISGNKSEDNLGEEQIWVVKTDAIGNLMWDKTIFTPGHDELGLAIQLNDECFVLATYTAGGVGGYKTQPAWGFTDYWMVKFCDTVLTSDLSPSVLTEHFSISPNPATNQLYVTLTKPITKNTILTITDMQGRVVKEISPLPGSPDSYREAGGEDIDISTLSHGIYLLKINGQVQRFVKM